MIGFVLLYLCIARVCVYAYVPLHNAYYPLCLESELHRDKATVFNHFEEPIVAWIGADSRPVAFVDGCPHRGASFDGADVDQRSDVTCPYHGFTFADTDGKLTDGIGVRPGCARLQKKIAIVGEGIVWVSSRADAIHPPFTGPKSGFRRISGADYMQCEIDQLIVNLLDPIHTSFVHSTSFGNSNDPEPKDFKVHPPPVEGVSGMSSYKYNSSPLSPSTWLLGSSGVEVVNSFHLPSTQSSNVSVAGRSKLITVHIGPGRAKGESRLYWTLDRDFATGFAQISDRITSAMLLMVLNEDRAMLKKCYPDALWGRTHSRYDTLQLQYRALYNKHRFG